VRSREVKIRTKRTREGPDFRVALYDDLGRFVLTARVFTLDGQVTDAIADYVTTGRLTIFAQHAIKRARLPGDPA
jgi:hypothetical protein